MRYSIAKPALFIVIILSATLYFPRVSSSARAASALPPLTGEAAVAHLKEQGLYSSLAEAVRVARGDARPLPSRSEPDAEAASSPDAALAINLPFTQLLRQTARDGAANGPATLTVMNAGSPVASGDARIARAAPGLFSANSSGQGVAAALALRVKADGSQSFEPIATFDSTQNRLSVDGRAANPVRVSIR